VQYPISRPLRVLLLEDDPADAELIEEHLRQSGMKVTTQRVDTAPAFTSAVREFLPDVVISDHALAQFNAKAALKVLRAMRPVAPLIVVSGAIDGQAAVACLRAGAEDFVPKHGLSRLNSAIEAALSVRRGLRKLSPRQVEVLRQVAEGYTTGEIASRLKLSVKTVETHRGALMKRLDIHDVVGLVRYAVRIGLVPPEL
jgi:DNA-binding NarL/FixJ family response regulator